MTTANPTRRRAAYPAGRADASTTTRTEKGISLARGPALILGTILTAAGLYLLYKARTFPPFSNFPNGTATRDGKYIFGIFAANGWTAMLTAVAGALLLFGAAQHLLAKTMSLIVGVALGAAAIIGLVSGDVLGMAATNGWTELGWGICSAILLFNTLMPRRQRTVVVADEGAPAAAEPVATRDGAVARDEEAAMARDRDPALAHDEEPMMARHEPVRDERIGGEPVHGDPVAGREEEPTVVHRDETATAPETRRE